MVDRQTKLVIRYILQYPHKRFVVGVNTQFPQSAPRLVRQVRVLGMRRPHFSNESTPGQRNGHDEPGNGGWSLIVALHMSPVSKEIDRQCHWIRPMAKQR